MAIMNYETQGIEKIDFEDSIFVTTDLDKDENKEVKGYIESRGGIVKDSVTKSTNYLIYGDGKEETTKYKKALELVKEKGLEINVLSLSFFQILRKGKGIIEFGSYPSEANGTAKPIKWLVLKQDGNKALLLSAYGLDAKPYNKKLKNITWETCTLRKWLNEDFYDASFSDEEKKRIITTNVQNTDNPKYNAPGGNDTEDKVFLLSIDEAEQYLTTFERWLSPTSYAVKQGVYKGFNGNCRWWLRSPGRGPWSAADVVSDGDIDDCLGNYVNYANRAVCPALWINLES